MSQPGKPPSAKKPPRKSTAAKTPRRARTPKNAFALPVRAADAVPVPEFAPVPRVYNRHDGWTPERQRAFIGALADTGCVSRAAAMVNMAQTNCYTLRRAPGAEEFAKAWDAALDHGLKRMKDIAFERAIEGELIPVFSGGKLMGHRRKRNDALLMFVLRHYGEDRAGRRVTVNYFSTRASAGAGAGVSTALGTNGGGAGVAGGAEAQASTTTVRTVISGPSEAKLSRSDTGSGRADRGEAAQALLDGFEGVELDGEARAAIMAALHECAARSRALAAGKAAGGEAGADAHAEDPDEPFVPLPPGGLPWRGTLEPPTTLETVDLPEGEDEWTSLGEEKPDWLVAFEEEQAAKAAAPRTTPSASPRRGR